MNDLKVKNWRKSTEEFDLAGKTERFLESIWSVRWLIVLCCVFVSGPCLYAGYLFDTSGQPEIKTVPFDHTIGFTYLGTDTGKYASNLQLDEGTMDKDGWYGQMVIRASDPDLIVWKYSLVKSGQVTNLEEVEHYPPPYYKLFDYDKLGARYQKEDFTKSNSFMLYVVFGLIALFIVAVYHTRWC